MASIKDLDVGEKFSSKLEEIRTKLLSQAMGEMLNEATVEFCQAHKQYMQSVVGKTPLYMHPASKQPICMHLVNMYTCRQQVWRLCYAVESFFCMVGVQRSSE